MNILSIFTASQCATTHCLGVSAPLTFTVDYISMLSSSCTDVALDPVSLLILSSCLGMVLVSHPEPVVWA